MTDERIASVDSVSDGVIHATMSIASRRCPVRGQYVLLHCGEETALCRFSQIDLTNPIHDNDAFAPYLMVHGSLTHWSGDVDIEKGILEELARIGPSGNLCPPQTNPASGTPIVLATEADISKFYLDNEHFLVLGYIPNSKIPFTITNRHFGDFENGGYGEAKHYLITGRSGSGKSVFATMKIVGIICAHPQMGLFIPDTAGDLSDPTKHDRGDFKWNYDAVLKCAGIDLEVVDIADIRLTHKSTLKYLLAPLLHDILSMDPQKCVTLSDRIVEEMFEYEVACSELTAENVHAQVVKHIAFVYAEKGRQAKLEDAQRIQANAGQWRSWERGIVNIRKFFDGREEAASLIRGILENGRKVVVRMGDAQGLTEKEQGFVMGELMEHLCNRARILYKSKGDMANALVVLDEAHQWVPESADEEHPTKTIVKRAFNETRKYGLGWMVITPRPSHVAKDVVAQAHTRYFGRGLGVGADRNHLKDILGDPGLAAYERLQAQGGFFFVGIGDDANLGTSGTYFAVQMFDGNATEAFITANPKIFSKVQI